MTLSAPRSVAIGAAWAAATTAAEIAVFPLAAFMPLDRMVIIALLLALWATSGIAFALLLRVQSPRCALACVVASMLGLAVALSAVWTGIWRWMPDLAVLARVRILIAPRGALISTFAYNLWAEIVYGGLFAAGWSFSQSIARQHSTLLYAQRARLNAERSFGQAQLSSLRGRLDARIVLEVLARARRLLEQRSSAGADLLDQLVDFLRAAMPVVRSGESNLRFELQLAQNYGVLCAWLSGARLRLSVAAAGDLSGYRFPAFFFVEILDAIRIANNEPIDCRLTVEPQFDKLEISVRLDGAKPAWLPPDMDYRLRVALSVACGSDAVIRRRRSESSQTEWIAIQLPISGDAPDQTATE